MSDTQKIEVHSDKFTPKDTNTKKADSIQFVQSGSNAPSSITITAPAGTDPATLFGVTTCAVPGTYPVQSTAVVGVTYALNLPDGQIETKDPGTVTVDG